jgi:glycosyltransferase involved in cell wall biosynthesis
MVANMRANAAGVLPVALPHAWNGDSLRCARRRIMVLSTWLPAPADNGRKQRTLAMLRQLAIEHEVFLVSLVSADEVALPTVEIPEVAQQWTFELPAFQSRSTRALIASLSTWPRSLSATWDLDLSARLSAIAQQHDVDAAIGTDLRTARYLMALQGCKVRILDEPDVSPFVYDSSAHRWGASAVRASLREWKYRQLLKTASSTLSAATVASVHEGFAYAALAERGRVELIENAICNLPDSPWIPPHSSQLLYCGSLRYGPNADAADWMAREILPLIRREHAAACLNVTGALPDSTDFITRHPQVLLAGRLDDLDAAYRASRVCVVPLRFGTGTRIKIIEALAYGMPVVTTSKGAEGLAVVHGQHVLVADDPREFAAATVRLLRDPDLSMDLGARGRELVAARYTWTVQGARLRDLVRELCADVG